MDEYTRHLQQKKKKGRGFSNFKLKVIADLFMVFAVASTTVVPMLLGSPSTENMTALSGLVVCQLLSWIAIPIYAWLLYTGFDHTQSMFKYGLRLFILAVVCEVPYDLCNARTVFDFQSQNPVWGLLIALIVVILLDELITYRRGTRIALSILLIVVGLIWNLLFHVGQTQAYLNIGMLTLAMVLVFYYMNKHENSMMFTAAALGAVCMIIPGFGVAFLHYRNGTLGYRHKWTKWAFYCVYPIMLILGALVVMQ